MKHENSDVVIHSTADYTRFCMISGNRGLNDHKIKRIIKEIDSGNDMLKYYPIQVKEIGTRLEILDGQHRFFICSKLGRPVYYIVVEEQKTMADIAKVNSNVEKWKQQDFINCYINNNNEHYKKLQNFLNTYGINIGTSLLLLSTGNPGNEGGQSILKDKFEKGLFEVKEWDKAVEVAEMCKKFEAFPMWRDRPFIIALFRINKAGKIPIDELVSAVTKNPEKLAKHHTQKDYIYNLEQIINIGKQKRIVIT